MGFAIVLLAIYAGAFRLGGQCSCEVSADRDTGKGVRWLDTEEPIDRAVDIAQDEECIAFLYVAPLTAMNQRLYTAVQVYAASKGAHAADRGIRRAAPGVPARQAEEGSGAARGIDQSCRVARARRVCREKGMGGSSVVCGTGGWYVPLPRVCATADSVARQGGPTVLSAAELSQALVHLAVPIVRTYAPRESASPVCATLFHDLQVVPFGESAGMMHVGPPAVGCEVELRGEGVDVLEDGGDPRGTVSRARWGNVRS